jgi:hypothetical protein
MNQSGSRPVHRFMRTRLFVFVAAIAAGIAVASGARAEEHYDVSTPPGQVVLTVKGDFHINKDFPWKLVIGDVKLDKSKFTLDEKTASVSGAPKGTGTLKGAVCSKDTCLKVEKEVTIK